MSSADVLRAVLERPDLRDHSLRFEEVPGFLFAIVNAPELIPPSEWIEEIFGGEMPVFATVEEANGVYSALIDACIAVNEFSLRVEDGGLPPGCVLSDDSMANLDDEALIAAWAQGFTAGHQWLENTWNFYLPLEDPGAGQAFDEMSDELGSALM